MTKKSEGTMRLSASDPYPVQGINVHTALQPGLINHLSTYPELWHRDGLDSEVELNYTFESGAPDFSAVPGPE